MASAVSGMAIDFSNPDREIELLRDMLRVQHCTHQVYHSDNNSDSFNSWRACLPQLDDDQDNFANPNDRNNPRLLIDGDGWRWNMPSNLGIKVSLYLLLCKRV